MKGLRRLGDERIQEAEVAAFLRKFDEAEKLFVQIDRKDLAVEVTYKGDVR